MFNEKSELKNCEKIVFDQISNLNNQLVEEYVSKNQ